MMKASTAKSLRQPRTEYNIGEWLLSAKSRHRGTTPKGNKHTTPHVMLTEFQEGLD
jgi:hypothetical protein